MNAIYRVSGLIIVLLLAAPAPVEAASDGFYCGSRIVSVGDRVWEVSRKCPEPFWRDTYDQPTAVTRQGGLLGFVRVEVWTLNFGPRQFMRRLEFVNGRLSRVQELGYGVEYEPGTRRCGPYDLSRSGDTIAEIFARCGLPDHRYDLPPRNAYGYYGGAARGGGARRVWTYEFGPRQQPRELLFVDGRLRRISSP